MRRITAVICCRGCDLIGGGAADSGEEVPVCVRSIAVVAPTDADYSFPSMGGVRDRQDIYTDGEAILDSPLGSVVHGKNGLYRFDYGGMQMIWVPPAERSLQGLFEMTKHQGEYEVQDILNIGEDPLKARDYKV